MPQSQANVELKSFSNGIVTNLTPLSGDMSTCSELDGWILHPDGSVESRSEKGLFFQHGGAHKSSVVQTYIWQTPKLSDNPLYVVLTDQKICIYEYTAKAGIGVLRHEDENQHITLPISVSEAAGHLILCNNDGGESNVGWHIQSYNRTSATNFALANHDIRINDTTGVFDGLTFLADREPDEGVTTFENAFYLTTTQALITRTQISKAVYNAINSGWTQDAITQTYRFPFSSPTHASHYSQGLDALNAFSAVRAVAARSLSGLSVATRGRVRVNLTNRSASRIQHMEDLDTTTVGLTTAQISAITPDSVQPNLFYDANLIVADTSNGGRFHVQSHEGRLFYIGSGWGTTNGDALSPNINTMLLFSQSVVSAKSFGACHAHNDLTSVEANSVLATDGGFISLPNIGIVEGMRSIGKSLLVFASTGIWEISSAGTFTSANYSVRQITTSPILSLQTLVKVNGNFMYWTGGGIKTLVPDERTGRLSEQHISSKIDTMVKGLAGAEHKAAVFDEIQGVVRWCYLPLNSLWFQELHLQLSLGAFHTHTLKETAMLPSGGQIIDYHHIQDSTGDDNVDVIYFNDDQEPIMKSYRANGRKARSELVTNVSTFGDGSKRKQATFLNAFFRQTEQSVNAAELNDPSSCLTRVAWDFSDTLSSNKWSPVFEAYRLKRVNMPTVGGTYDYGRNVVETRSKVRGSGNALSIRMISPLIMNCHLYGVNMSILGNGRT